MESIIAKYVASIGKRPDELQEARIVRSPDNPTGPIAWDVHLVFGNRHVTYTRVAKFWLNEGIHFKSITQKTRLHVPINEVPRGAQIYHGKVGPIRVAGPWKGDAHLVECEFYYAKGEGAMAGGKLWVKEAELLDLFGAERLAELVGGCKFDFWAICHEMATGRKSVFS